MKALDPTSPGSGKLVEVTIAEGQCYTSLCPLCGFENGVRIVGPGIPPLPAKPDPCVLCGNILTCWLPLEQARVPRKPYRRYSGKQPDHPPKPDRTRASQP